MEKIDYLKEFMTKLQSLDRSKDKITVFKDFLTLCTCSLAQPIYRSEKLEQRYLETAKQYTKEQAEEFSKLLAFLVMALEEKYQDFLGEVHMSLNLSSKANGRYFTPYPVCKFMAEINFFEVENSGKLQDKELITLSEPCCGSGAMIIAFAETMRKHNFNYQNQLYVEAIDINDLCFMMTYIQLSLLGIPAKVILGDTLSLKFQQVLYTPFYYLNGIDFKLQKINSDTKQELIEPINNQKQNMQLQLLQL